MFRALSVLRRVLVLLVVFSSSAGAWRVGDVWGGIAKQANDFSVDQIVDTYDLTKSKVVSSSYTMSFKVAVAGQVQEAFVSGAMIYNVLAKADMLYRAKTGNPYPYASNTIKWYFDPKPGDACGESCTDILGNQGVMNISYYSGDGYSVSTKLAFVSGPSYGGGSVWSFQNGPCAPAGVSSSDVEYATFGGAAYDAAISKARSFWNSWKVAAARCNSFGSFVKAAGPTFISDYVSALDYLAKNFINPTEQYVHLANYAPLAATCGTNETCPDSDFPDEGGTGGGVGSPSPGGSTPVPPGGTVNVNIPPACTRRDGQTSGNPYDCAPSDAETNCSIIDLPCNLKRAFVPSPDFFSDSFKEYVNKQLNLPVEPTDHFVMSTGLSIAPEVNIDFSFMKNDAVQNVLRLIAWFQVAFWILNYIGFPNPFGGSRRGDSFAATALDSVLPPDSAGVDTGSKEHYDRLRADESWKS